MQFPNIEQIARELGYRYDKIGPIHRFYGSFIGEVREISVIPHWNHSGVEYIQKDTRGTTKAHLWGQIERHADQKEGVRQLKELLMNPQEYTWDSSLL